MIKGLFNRERGTVSSSLAPELITQKLATSLDYCKYKRVASRHLERINSIDIDQAEQKYLLSGAGDRSIAIYDIEEPTNIDSSSTKCQHTSKAIVSVPRAHERAVSSVIWYPHDTGMFVTSSFDGTVKIWDTNTLDAETFNLKQRVYSASMSPISTRHCLVATATETSQIRLCDPMTGSVVHTLTGHTNSVLSVAWSPVDENLLVSGSRDGTVRLWDIRRAGWISCLDQYNTAYNRFISKHHSLNYSVHSRKDWANVPIAHHGSIAGLCFSNGGRYLVTAATDGLSCWDILSGENKMIHYEKAKATPFVRKFQISNNDKILFYPVGEDIYGFDLLNGTHLLTLKGHFDNVACLSYHPSYQELYSGSADKNIVIWTPGNKDQEKHPGEQNIEDIDVDEWSDEE